MTGRKEKAIVMLSKGKVVLSKSKELPKEEYNKLNYVSDIVFRNLFLDWLTLQEDFSIIETIHYEDSIAVSKSYRLERNEND